MAEQDNDRGAYLPGMWEQIVFFGGDMAKKIDEATLAILSRVTVEGNIVFLTCGQLDRKQYAAVNEVLENMGGKWNRGKKGHVFSEDPTDKLEAVMLTGEIVPHKKYGYFPTPADLADEVIMRADIKDGMSVLEPSAGQAALAGPAAKIVGIRNVHCIELLENNCDVLMKKGFTVQREDFLSIEPQGLVDRVVMNPPFEKQADIDHVLRAWEWVVPGGRLVSIMASSVLFRDNRKTMEFRDLVNTHGTIDRLPEGSFKESGTGVNTVLVVMDKPA